MDDHAAMRAYAMYLCFQQRRFEAPLREAALLTAWQLLPRHDQDMWRAIVRVVLQTVFPPA